MDIKNNTILITGGATGIGFALAEDFIKAGNKVIICGRRQNRLDEARSKLPQIITRTCDVTKKAERESLYAWIKSEHPELNVLVNNAGIQRRINMRKGTEDLFAGGDEIETNLTAPVHLCAYFIPHLMEKSHAAIINVSSGLGFIPIAAYPVYCGTKAGLHLFTISLRHQLRNTKIKVFEIVPPAVDTELGKESFGDREEKYRGMAPSQLARKTLPALANNEYEIVIGDANNLVAGARSDPEKAFQKLNRF